MAKVVKTTKKKAKMTSEPQEIPQGHLTVDDLKKKYGAEVVESKIAQIEKQIDAKVTSLDETMFKKEDPGTEEVLQLAIVTAELMVVEARIIRLLQLSKGGNKYIPSGLRSRINNLFVNNRVIMDTLYKNYELNNAESNHIALTQDIERINTIFILATGQERADVIDYMMKYMEDNRKIVDEVKK